MEVSSPPRAVGDPGESPVVPTAGAVALSGIPGEAETVGQLGRGRNDKELLGSIRVASAYQHPSEGCRRSEQSVGTPYRCGWAGLVLEMCVGCARGRVHEDALASIVVDAVGGVAEG